jgi:hypothetical protein
MAEQRKQNDRMAGQSQAVVEGSHHLAEAAKELVERDADARRELIAAQQELTTQLNEQQSAIYTGHEQLEQDRREIAQQRNRDPFVAAVIQNFGLIAACRFACVKTCHHRSASYHAVLTYPRYSKKWRRMEIAMATQLHSEIPNDHVIDVRTGGTKYLIQEGHLVGRTVRTRSCQGGGGRICKI